MVQKEDGHYHIITKQDIIKAIAYYFHGRKQKNIHLFRRVLVFLKPHKTMFLLTVLGTILNAVLSPLRPLILFFMIDKFVGWKN